MLLLRAPDPLCPGWGIRASPVPCWCTGHTWHLQHMCGTSNMVPESTATCHAPTRVRTTPRDQGRVQERGGVIQRTSTFNTLNPFYYFIKDWGCMYSPHFFKKKSNISKAIFINLEQKTETKKNTSPFLSVTFSQSFSLSLIPFSHFTVLLCLFTIRHSFCNSNTSCFSHTLSYLTIPS